MPMLVVLDKRCQGSEHIKTAKPCQDYSLATTDRRKSCAYALVADGHGGEKYFRSEHGSRLAVTCTVEALNKVLRELFSYIRKNDLHVIDKTLKNLCSRILILWREKVKSHFYENPLTDEEKELCWELKIDIPLAEEKIFTLYGSTLLASVYFANYGFWFSLQIGDGKTVIIRNDNSVFYPIQEDDEMGFGVTASLCGKNALEKFRYNYGFEKLNSIFVMSDGLADSFDAKKLPNFLMSIKDNALLDDQKTKDELAAFLPRLSEQGSGDDISIAGIFEKENESMVKNLFSLFPWKF